MNPAKIKPYQTAHKMKTDRENSYRNDLAYIIGIYVRESIISTVGNMFSKGSNAKYKFPDKPYEFYKVEQEEQHELTEEEKKKKTEELFLKLNIMKSNFDLAKN